MPLTLEGPPRTMRGVPALAVATLPAIGALGASRTARPVRAGAVIVGALRRGLAACGERGSLPAAAPRPVGFRP